MKERVVKVKNQRQQYLNTLKEIRSRNFQKNLPFLILSDKLPEGQVYREFADGRIEIHQVFATGAKYESKFVNLLMPSEADRLREEYELF